jgi:hypothetical protein
MPPARPKSPQRSFELSGAQTVLPPIQHGNRKISGNAPRRSCHVPHLPPSPWKLRIEPALSFQIIDLGRKDTGKLTTPLREPQDSARFSFTPMSQRNLADVAPQSPHVTRIGTVTSGTGPPHFDGMR